MALQSIAGLPGFAYGMISSMNDRAIGKFTDSNHLQSLWDDAPSSYDKKIIEIYTQSSLVANDFLAMVNQSDPYIIKGKSDAFTWDVEVPFQFAKVIEVPADTANGVKVGIDGHEFGLVLDTNEFAKNSIITSDRMYGQQFSVVQDPIPHNGGFYYLLSLNTLNPKVDFVDQRWLSVGTEYELISGSIGEFDQDLLGLRRTGKKLQMFDSIGAGIGMEHTITSWADQTVLRDSKTNNPLDITYYVDQQRNSKAITMRDIKWEPTVERLMREQMLEMKVTKMIWEKPGTAKSNGSRQEVKKISGGIIHAMRNKGNLTQFNAGEFSPNIFRVIFGDLFYRRVDIKDRRVKVYTNEAGFELFNDKMKEDAFASGFTFNIGEGNRFMQGSGQNLVMNYGFDGMITRETGRVELIHLKELDLPHNNQGYGQGIKSAPLYLVFDVSPNGDGTLKNNVREVRKEGMPSGTWGYIDGRTHHLGHAASKGHSAASKFPGYTIFMDDRYDVFIEDLSRTAIIEQIPQI